MVRKTTTSPTPTKAKEQTEGVTLMDFPSAIRVIIDGGKVTKEEWQDPNYYLQLVDGRLKIHKPDEKFYDLIVSDGDLFGEDWYKLNP